jgi:hypothetical protein
VVESEFIVKKEVSFRLKDGILNNLDSYKQYQGRVRKVQNDEQTIKAAVFGKKLEG